MISENVLTTWKKYYAKAADLPGGRSLPENGIILSCLSEIALLHKVAEEAEEIAIQWPNLKDLRTALAAWKESK